MVTESPKVTDREDTTCALPCPSTAADSGRGSGRCERGGRAASSYYEMQSPSLETNLPRRARSGRKETPSRASKTNEEQTVGKMSMTHGRRIHHPRSTLDVVPVPENRMDLRQ